MTDLAIVLVIILILVLLWRGPRTLPKLGEAMGRGVRAARREAQADAEAELDERKGDGPSA